MNFLNLIFILGCFLYIQPIQSASDKILCYYASWATTRQGNGKVASDDLDPNLCTHINYAFLGLNDDGSILILDEHVDIELENLKKLSDLKQINPNLKVILSLGGYAAGTAIFTAISSSPEKRATLAKSAIDYLQKYNFDGLDVDWEYPLEGDRENFIILLNDLKEAFKPHNYLLTVAVAAIPTDAAYSVKEMSDVLDVINVMTYDFHGSWSGFTAEHSPLYSSPTEGEWQRDNLNANSSITHWILEGADPQKLAIGIAFYGHSYVLTDPGNHAMGAPSSGPAPAGQFTNNMGTLGFNELCEFYPNAQKDWDDNQKVPFLYQDNIWVGYDNDQSVALKAQYAKDNNLAGVMIWSIETDDTRGVCGDKFSLLRAINEVMK